MTRVILLDVGHGNCSIVKSDASTAVVDSPTGALLLDTLRDLGVDQVETAIISHADKDHIAGILALLTSSEIRVGRVFVNPDGQKKTKTWNDFLVAVAVAESKGTCEVITSLSTTTPGSIEVGAARITVLCPTAALALRGVGGTTVSGRGINSNSLSGVLRISLGGSARGILLAADIDEVGLDEALSASVNLEADVLVFPHHGGLPGGADAKAFTTALLGAVKPETVIFSNGRGRNDNPRAEIVSAVRDQGCLVGCTQLSERCQAQATDSDSYLEPLRASGRNTGACCAGSITVELSPKACRPSDLVERHQSFITDKVATPMCRSGNSSNLKA
jgi:competence protein ComEC